MNRCLRLLPPLALLCAVLPLHAASAQFPISIPGVDPARAATGAAAKQLAPYIAEQTPIRLDPVELYPTVDDLPGAPFKLSGDENAQKKTVASVIDQLKHSTSGVVTLAPGDYAIVVRLYCMSHSRPARAPLAFLLGTMRGKRAPAIVAMNSRAASSTYGFSQLQTTSWTIQGGLGYAEFPGPERAVVDALIPDYKDLLSGSTLDQIQSKWNALARFPGAPSLDGVLGQMGPAGQTIVELRQERDQILSEAADFDALRRTFAPFQNADGPALSTPWSTVDSNVWMRMLTPGHYGDVGTVQVRVTGSTSTSVPLVSSIAYGRCTPQITTQGSAYACTQPLSFEPLTR